MARGDSGALQSAINQLGPSLVVLIRGIKRGQQKAKAQKAIADLLGSAGHGRARTILQAMDPEQALNLIVRQKLGRQSAREKAASAAEHERQVGERQTQLETMRETSREKGATERAKAASDLETQRQMGREKVATIRATGKSAKPTTPKADDAGLLISQLESSEDGETRRLGRDLRDSVERDFGDPNVLRDRAVKVWAAHQDEGNGLYSQTNLQRLNRALAGKTGAGATKPAGGGPPPAPDAGEGVPRGTSAAPRTPAQDRAATAKAAGYSRDDVVKHLQAIGAPPEEFQATNEAYGVTAPAQTAAALTRPSFLPQGGNTKRSASGEDYMAAAAAKNAGRVPVGASPSGGVGVGDIGMKLLNTIPEALPFMSPGGGALAMGATLGRPLLERALPQMQDDPWSQPGDFTAGTSDPFKVDQRLRAAATERQVGELLRSLIGVP